MAQNAGEVFGIHAAGKGMGCEGVSKIMEANVGESRIRQNLFHALVGGVGNHRMLRSDRVMEDPFRQCLLFPLPQELRRAGRKCDRSHIITKRATDFGEHNGPNGEKLLRIPAFAFLYLLGHAEKHGYKGVES